MKHERITKEHIETYRINYQPEAWKEYSKSHGHCCVALGAVYAIEALCQEVEKLKGWGKKRNG